MYHIKREVWFGEAKVNRVNYRRLIDQNKVIKNIIKDVFIKMNKGTLSEENINMYCDNHKQILNEIDQAYRCMRSLKIMN